MTEEKVGSFVINQQGNMVPNENDEAMLERKKQASAQVEEVITDAGQ